MFTQFFGSYLLNNKLVLPEQLQEALEKNKEIRLKLGILAINAGYMTAEQVDKVHNVQAIVDKRFGDIAVDMGYMTNSQVDELLSSQKIGYLSLGQSLVDKGYMTNSQFEQAINNYKKENKIECFLGNAEQNEKIEEIINNFYNFKQLNDATIYNEYVSLLFRNIVRFIGDDFIPMQSSTIHEFSSDWIALQEIFGEFKSFIAIGCNEETFISFASRFANEQYQGLDDYVKASVGEFLNLHNGLFCVNMSNEREKELDLMPQQILYEKIIKSSNKSYLIPIYFHFGTVNFIIGSKAPSII